MAKTHPLKTKAKTHKPNFAILLLAFVILLMINIAFSSCKDETETYYRDYGTVEKIDNNNFRIKLDAGYILNPTKSGIPGEALADSIRVIAYFSILEELDSTYNVNLEWTREILTKSILPYSESILDSMGNDPVKINRAWIASGFLNFEFLYEGGMPQPNPIHMFNLLQHPSENGKLVLEFRHNAFSDKREAIYSGIVSFPIDKLIQEIEKPEKIQIKYRDSANSTKTLEIAF